MPRAAVCSRGSPSGRSECQSVSEPCGSASMTQAAAAERVRVGGEMRGERALAGAALARGERDDVHGCAPCCGMAESWAGMVNEGLPARPCRRLLARRRSAKPAKA